MKALTVRQPWSWAIAKGYKPVENRTWGTSYRGPLAIHSSKTLDHLDISAVLHMLRELGLPVPQRLADELPLTEVGVVVAVVDLVGICPGGQCGCGPWAEPLAKHWQLANPRPLEKPEPARGHLQLWDVDLGATA